MERDDFVFKKSWIDVIAGLPPQVRLDVYEGIMQYALSDTVPNLKVGARAAFEFVKRDIDSYHAWEQRRQSISDARRAAGRKGAEVTNSLPRQKSVLPDFAENAEKPPSASRTRIEEHQDNIDDVNNKNQKKKKENAEKKDKDIPRHVDAKLFIAFFNSELAQAGCIIPHRCSYTARRGVAIAARANEHGNASLRTMVEKARDSEFLNGGNNRAWVATLDWLLRPNNYVKVIEGNYDNTKCKSNYVKTQQSDGRRGTAAGQHTADEY